MKRKAVQDKPAQVALVTNAADFAGPPAVDALIAAGLRVLVHDKTFTDEDTWSRFSATHPGAEFVGSAGGASLIEAAWEFDSVDVIVSNDHYPATCGHSEAASLDNLRKTLEALVVEPFALLKEAIPRLKEQGGGNIVMITSCRTHLPIPGAAIPDAARAAANALVRSLAVELAPFEIPVNAIAPNFLSSEAYYPRAIFVDDPRGRAFVESSVPARRLGRPEEIGEVIAFLATAKARFLTGAIIDFAGAWPASPVLPR